MQFGSNGLGDTLRRWRERLPPRPQPSHHDPATEPRPRAPPDELWACAMAPEYVTLAAMMALDERDATETDGHRRAE